MGVVTTGIELLAAVKAAFEITGHGLTQWPDPHPDRPPLDEEYSRLSNPGRWRILGARIDAWLLALVDAGVAAVELDTSIRWRVVPAMVILRTERIVAFAAGALPLVVAHSQLGDVNDAGVVLAVGDPAICVTWFPDCGCDACDSGSRDELDRLDAHVYSIVSGAFRWLCAGDREITVTGEDGWSASGQFGRREVDAILADPVGWDEVTGRSWLDPS
jgi:Family of unknown function (DUF6226)